jgi:hypothetical protein
MVGKLFFFKRGQFVKTLSLFLVFLGAGFGQICCVTVERNVSVELIEKRINGKLFAYRLDVMSGSKIENSRKEQWSIDGKQLDREEYEQIMDIDLLEQIKKEREEDYTARLARHDFKKIQRVALTKKLIKKLINEIEQKCTAFQRYELNQYMVYNSNTIANEIDFTNIPTHYLAPARQLLSETDDEFPFEKAESVLASLQGYPNRIENLFEDAVKRAIDQCDDTERLKRLLEIVS